MAAKFYRKLSPDTKPVLGNGATVRFSTNDGVIGFFSTDNEYIQAEFARFASEQRYGITEVDRATYEAEYVQKKTDFLPSSLHLREEIGAGMSGLRQISEIKRQNAVAAVVVEGSDIKRRAPVVAQQATPEIVAGAQPKVQEFKPKVGKRGAKPT